MCCLKSTRTLAINTIQLEVHTRFPLRARHQAGWQALKIISPTWFDHQEENFSYKEVQFKMFCWTVKTSCLPAKKLIKKPPKDNLFNIQVCIQQYWYSLSGLNGKDKKNNISRKVGLTMWKWAAWSASDLGSSLVVVLVKWLTKQFNIYNLYNFLHFVWNHFYFSLHINFCIINF